METIVFNNIDLVYRCNSLIFILIKLSLGSNAGSGVAGVATAHGTSRAELNTPSAIQIDAYQVMYILDTNNYRILRWPLGDQFGTVVVNGRGTGTTLDKIGISYDLFVDNQYNIYVSEYGNHRVSKWIAGNNTIGQLVEK